MRHLFARLQLAWSVLASSGPPADTYAARLLRQRNAAWVDLDSVVAAVLAAPDLETAKRAAAISLLDGEAGGDGHTWSLARPLLTDRTAQNTSDKNS